MLSEGDTAPEFALPDADGKQIALRDFRGRYVAVYFYPKDDTTGCTKEALSFSELASGFQAANAIVIGISPDSPKSHAKFRDKYTLGITLLADEDKTAIQAYGAWGEKKMYGKAYMGVERSTFLVGPDGTVLHIWRGVKVPGHAEAVLALLKSKV